MRDLRGGERPRRGHLRDLRRRTSVRPRRRSALDHPSAACRRGLPRRDHRGGAGLLHAARRAAGRRWAERDARAHPARQPAVGGARPRRRGRPGVGAAVGRGR
ncbi:hypothetical protein [Ornithinimicrobium kibberense]|uniref:hypothetical protein n=1 Tax=Ornithinimicrobium kibberense TaxID=282060 RepID=UPI0036215AEC